MPTYQPGIPTGLVDLDVDYQNLQDNFQQLNIAYGVDHVPFSDTSGVPPGGISGMHTIIHLQSNAAPSAVATVGQLFNTNQNDNINTDTVLWFLTGGGRLLQLTRNFVPTLNTNGATFLPGGIILQWGTQALPGTGTTNFLVRNTAVYNVQTTLIGDSSSSNIVSVIATTAGNPGKFTWNFTGSSSYTSFFWMAIGI